LKAVFTDSFFCMEINIDSFNSKANNLKKENESFYRKLKSKPPKDLDEKFHSLHEEVFEEIDCLKCANCCKTTSPIFYERDVERAAKAVKMRPGDFIEKYLRVDEDKDYVLKQSPCAFLDAENYCMIYADRPNACREYPHTNRKKMQQIMDLTMKNTLVCPAVFEMTERLKAILK
jgi:Fe-S-cluster containining protein